MGGEEWVKCAGADLQSIDEEAAELSGQYSPGSERASMRPVRDIGGGGGG